MLELSKGFCSGINKSAAVFQSVQRKEKEWLSVVAWTSDHFSFASGPAVFIAEYWTSVILLFGCNWETDSQNVTRIS